LACIAVVPFPESTAKLLESGRIEMYTGIPTRSIPVISATLETPARLSQGWMTSRVSSGEREYVLTVLT